MTSTKNKSDGGLAIGMVSASFLPVVGGVEVGLHNIATRLAERGHRPVVFAPPQSWWQLRNAGFGLSYPVYPLPPKLAGALKRAPRLLLPAMDAYLSLMDWRFGIDVWHATVGYPIGVAAAHYGERKRRPVLVRCVGEDIQCVPELGYGARLDPRVDRLVRRWLPKAGALVAITGSVAAEYRDIGAAEERIIPIPNGVDLERFSRPADRKSIRRRLEIADSEVLVLSAGRYHAKKNFEGLLRAFALARTLIGTVSAKLVLAGGGLSALRPMLAELKLEEHVRIVESTAQIGKGQGALSLPPDALVGLYKSADAFALLSHVETFGIVLAEAMAAGLPVLTTDAPGCRDVVRNGVDGILVPPGDPEAAAQILAALITQPELRTRFAERSLRRARDFSWDTVVSSYLELYRTLLRQ